MLRKMRLRWDYFVNPAGKNEDHKLELSGIRELLGNSRASGCPEAGGLRYPFSIRNKT